MTGGCCTTPQDHPTTYWWPRKRLKFRIKVHFLLDACGLCTVSRLGICKPDHLKLKSLEMDPFMETIKDQWPISLSQVFQCLGGSAEFRQHWGNSPEIWLSRRKQLRCGSEVTFKVLWRLPFQVLAKCSLKACRQCWVGLPRLWKKSPGRPSQSHLQGG